VNRGGVGERWEWVGGRGGGCRGLASQDGLRLVRRGVGVGREEG